jgi:hypothetical protein
MLPKLGLFEHLSFPAGNIALMNEFLMNHNFTPFIDAEPGVAAAEKYKALGRIAYQPHMKEVRTRRGPGGLKAFVSADGIRWKKLRDEAVVPEEWGKYFDSQNYAFWSETERCYVCYQTGPCEMSLFLTEGRRYMLRLDGFASVNAPLSGGEMITNPFQFSGQQLEINYSTPR